MQFIFDLVGYLGAAVFVTIVMLYWVFIGGVLLFDLWVEKITNGDVSDLLGNRLWDGNVAASMLSALASIVYSVIITYSFRLTDTTWLQGLQQVSIYLTPVFSYVVSVGVVLLTVHWLATKGYKICKVVKSLEEKNK